MCINRHDRLGIYTVQKSETVKNSIQSREIGKLWAQQENTHWRGARWDLLGAYWFFLLGLGDQILCKEGDF